MVYGGRLCPQFLSAKRRKRTWKIPVMNGQQHKYSSKFTKTLYLSVMLAEKSGKSIRKLIAFFSVGYNSCLLICNGHFNPLKGESNRTERERE